jgi:CubicO group peptidase (beta-lactamase class C family)
MTRLDELLVDAVKHENAPFVVAAVADREGVLWQGSAGKASPSAVAGPETVFRLFSMTKAIAGLAVAILVEREQVSLDTPLESVLPDFADLKVLERMGPDGPVLRPPRRPVTMRHLLTHTSGFTLEAWSKKQAIWQLLSGTPHPVTGTRASLRHPLMFDPGERWAYGFGQDWLAPIVERIDGRTIVRFCQDEIFDPLGMRDTGFEPDFAGDRLATVSLRCNDGEFAEFEFSPPRNPEVYGMGQSLYGTAPDYIRFLRMVLNRGELDGRRVISPETMDLLLNDQASGMSIPPMLSIAPLYAADVDLCPGVPKTSTAAFMRTESDVPDMRSAGSLMWAGFLNTHYWVDPAKNVAAVFMTQTLPFCDPGFMAAYEAFERVVYRELSQSAGLRSTRAVSSVG